eukprot:13990544-Ditylum_brightwellii.AAC.1
MDIKEFENSNDDDTYHPDSNNESNNNTNSIDQESEDTKHANEHDITNERGQRNNPTTHQGNG